MPVNSLADYRPLFKIAKHRGVKILALVVNPATVVALIKEITNMGENPFPRCRRTWKRFWRKPEMRPFLYGVPIACNPLLPLGCVRCATPVPMPPDIAEMFMGDLKIGVAKASQSNPPGPQIQQANIAAPNAERGVLEMLSESVNGERASMSDLMVKAMDGVDSANGLIVLRFWGDRFDVTTSFNPLEVQTVMQRAMMRIMSEGIQGQL